jgi:hypothetical protein
MRELNGVSPRTGPTAPTAYAVTAALVFSLLCLLPAPSSIASSGDMVDRVGGRQIGGARECLGNIRVGMKIGRAVRILTDYGFEFAGGAVLCDVTMIYECKEDPATIILSVNSHTGAVTYKELGRKGDR